MSLIAGLCVLLAACGGSGSSSETTSPTGPTLSIVVPAASMQSGTTMQASATLGGSPASGVTWSTSDWNIFAVDADGVLRAVQAGSAVLTARSGTLSATKVVEVTPGTPVAVRLYSGDRQVGNAGSAVTDPLCTIVVDAASNLVIGVLVTYVPATGGGTMGSPTAAKTDSRGISTSGAFTLGPDPGENTVTASTPGLPPVVFHLTGR